MHVTSTQELPYPHADQLRDHWWWRPGWSVGRRFYTWHLTFDRQHELHSLVRAYQAHLATVPGLDLIPQQWLHLTMQGVGFTHETSVDDVDRIVATATVHLRKVGPQQLTFHRAVVLPEAIALPPNPPEAVWAIRRAVRGAIADVWGDSRVPESEDRFRPHLSVAYNNEDRPAGPVVEVVGSMAYPPVTVTVDSASLIVLDRDERIYRWRTYATVPLGLE
jgi:2'-5' RNA ligase